MLKVMLKFHLTESKIKGLLPSTTMVGISIPNERSYRQRSENQEGTSESDHFVSDEESHLLSKQRKELQCLDSEIGQDAQLTHFWERKCSENKSRSSVAQLRTFVCNISFSFLCKQEQGN
ncbi:hypothetical protein NPIL_632361 [Nephila pilipes]|uniref:Uncharacterized protein n=1 Tax=Nephila pilipes TaxID=299642 RepID=A0A8X6PS95_NEPPI|nr:hypothetical protein NPIL_632361 [Nephila pilipes]